MNSELLIQKSRFRINSDSDSESNKVANLSSSSVFSLLDNHVMSLCATREPVLTVIHELELRFATLLDSESESELILNRDF